MWRLLKLLVLLVIGWVIYVQFWGTTDQKQLRKNLFENVRQTGKSVGDIAKKENEKLKGKSFKEVLGKVGETIDKVKTDTQNFGSKTKEKVAEIERKKKELDNLLEKFNLKKGDDDELSAEEDSEVKKKVKSLGDLMEDLAKDMESQ